MKLHDCGGVPFLDGWTPTMEAIRFSNLVTKRWQLIWRSICFHFGCHGKTPPSCARRPQRKQHSVVKRLANEAMAWYFSVAMAGWDVHFLLVCPQSTSTSIVCISYKVGWDASIGVQRLWGHHLVVLSTIVTATLQPSKDYDQQWC